MTYSDTVEVIAEDDRLIIKKSEKKKPHKTIQERFENFKGVYEFEAIDWGKPVGREIW